MKPVATRASATPAMTISSGRTRAGVPVVAAGEESRRLTLPVNLVPRRLEQRAANQHAWSIESHEPDPSCDHQRRDEQTATPRG
jgi:hypothetical protein